MHQARESQLYNISEMRAELENAVSIAEESVRNKFIDSFKNIYAEATVPDVFPNNNHSIKKHLIRNSSDLEGIFTGPGFYVILTSYSLPNNECRLASSAMKAVYRGECATVKKRVQSHLFNKHYKQEYEARKLAYLSKPENSDKEFYEQFWPACLKIDPTVSGINIDEPDYAQFSWMVIVHEMKGSIREVREQAELAFDRAFGKPEASRENA